MRRSLFVSLVVLVCTLPLTINAVANLELSSPAVYSFTQVHNTKMVKDSPPDTTPYVRTPTAEDYSRGQAIVVATNSFVVDPVVNNTDATLTATDTQNDGEPSIAINPANPLEIVMTAFSGGWGANTPLWHSTDGGNTWTKRFTIPVPTGLGAGCPCDQAIDYGRGSLMSGTFLKTDIYTGTTSNPANAASWNWRATMGLADETNSTAVGNGSADQPWLLVNRDPVFASQDNVYVAYDDFDGAPDMQVAVSLGTNPPNFVRDNQSGVSGGGFVNPGHRLAVDTRNGWVYSLFQQRAGAGDDNSHSIRYLLNRSTDGGQTWTLNGNGNGITVATADSVQGFSSDATFDGGGNCTSNPGKFGTVNALLGGILHATVDPNNGDVYYVYGNRDSGTNNGRLSIIRLTDNGMGGLTVGTPNFVTGQVDAALPSVSVASNGIVGVLYTQYDGMSPGGIPMFSAHFALSTDQGATFAEDLTLESWLSSAANDGTCRQRVLGDYQQVKMLGTTFYGTFTGNGFNFGRAVSNHDPIFFKVFTGCNGLQCPPNIVVSTDPNQCTAVVNYANPTSNGDCGTVTCTPKSGSVFDKGTTNVLCTSQAGSSCMFTVTVNDTQEPSITCAGNVIASAANGCPFRAASTVCYPAPTVSDNCPGVTFACSPPSGSPIPVGTTTVTCTATDTSGNKKSCSFTVRVFSGCVQDDVNVSRVAFYDHVKGAYRICLNGTVFAENNTGSGVSRVLQGCVLTIQDNSPTSSKRVTIKIDMSVKIATVTVKSPPGQLLMTITDQNLLNNTGCASCGVGTVLCP